MAGVKKQRVPIDELLQSVNEIDACSRHDGVLDELTHWTASMMPWSNMTAHDIEDRLLLRAFDRHSDLGEVEMVLRRKFDGRFRQLSASEAAAFAEQLWPMYPLARRVALSVVIADVGKFLRQGVRGSERVGRRHDLPRPAPIARGQIGPLGGRPTVLIHGFTTDGHMLESVAPNRQGRYAPHVRPRCPVEYDYGQVERHIRADVRRLIWHQELRRLAYECNVLPLKAHVAMPPAAPPVRPRRNAPQLVRALAPLRRGKRPSPPIGLSQLRRLMGRPADVWRDDSWIFRARSFYDSLVRAEMATDEPRATLGCGNVRPKRARLSAVKTAEQESLVRKTTTQRFEKDVILESEHQPVLVEFFADWCGPCKLLAPMLEKLVVHVGAGKVRLVGMDIDEYPAVAAQLGIKSIPTVFAFIAGRLVDGFIGAQPEGRVLALIERLVNAEAAAYMSVANA
jgi:thioredoxin